MPEITIFKLDGKPLTKFIQTIGDWWSDKRRPKQTRLDADAEAYRIKVIEKAKTEARLQSAEDQLAFIERIKQRNIDQEVNRQYNIDAIVQETAKQLEGETVNNEPVNKDWISRFFNIAQDISDQEIQMLWSKILAGEIQQPNSFSLKTLEVLQNLGKKQAEVFQYMCNFVIKEGTAGYIFFSKRNTTHVNSITADNILTLDELGLMNAQEWETRFEFNAINKYHLIKYGHKTLKFITEKLPTTLTLPILSFTTAGYELYNLVTPSFNSEYYQTIITYITKHGFKVQEL